MKYLKYNESLDIDTLIEQTDMYLAYLKDEGYTARVYDISYKNFKGKKIDELSIRISNETRLDFDWNDIKDYVLPYIELLEENFDCEMYFTDWLSSTEKYTKLSNVSENNIQVIKIILTDKKPKLNYLQKFNNYFKSKSD